MINILLKNTLILDSISKTLNDKSEQARNFAMKYLSDPFFGIVVVIGLIIFIFISFRIFRKN